MKLMHTANKYHPYIKNDVIFESRKTLDREKKRNEKRKLTRFSFKHNINKTKWI